MQPTEIKSPGELLGAAIVREQEAARHFAEMAGRMRHYGNEEAWVWFERLERESNDRVERAMEWARLEEIELVEPVTRISLDHPSQSTTYDAEARDPYRSSAYKALAYAAHKADRTFSLYTHYAAASTDPATERVAAILANDALNRARLLQARRRRAYHTERRGPWQQQLDAALKLRTVAELYAIAAGIEQRLTDLYTTLAEHHDHLDEAADELGTTTQRCLRELDDTVEAAAAPPPPYDMELTGQNVHKDMLLLFTESERAFNFYDTVMSHAADEEIMLAAQELAETALKRLKTIRKAQKKYAQPAA